MTPDLSSPPAEADPVRAALADPAVLGRLRAAARVFLGRRGYSLSPIRRSEEAAEVASVAQARAYGHKDRFDPTQGEVVRWLVGFVRNAAREHARKHPCGPPVAAPGLDDLAADLDRSVADVIADREQVERLLAALAPDDRDLVRRRYMDGETCAALADRFGTNENAVRQRCFRLIGRLREVGRAAGEGRP
ncbi:MAG: sigma-70 family RNA polymerase sigma factor [Gemmataceae bacterium]|nr:sigma-70 family RNA polymerase sigma factor [Gemmataceae bacterium]